MQTCVVHLIRNSVRYASRKDSTAIVAAYARSTPRYCCSFSGARLIRSPTSATFKAPRIPNKADWTLAIGAKSSREFLDHSH